jgi:putative addiction module component (TIGR02574 family)
MSQYSLPADILQLPVPVRLELVEQLWDSIAADQDQFRLTKAQTVELDCRLTAHAADPARGAPWSEVKKRLVGE